MGVKKIKVLQIADRLDKFVSEYKKAREFFTSKLGIGIGQLSDSDLVKHRAKVTTSKPAKFLAEFDGASLCFAVTIGSERIKISEVIVRNIGDANKVGGLMKKLVDLGLGSR